MNTTLHYILSTLCFLFFCNTLSSQENIAIPIRYTNKALLDVSYSLPTDAREVMQVELWVTEDGSETWKLAATSKDFKSPIHFQAPKDGVYGLSIYFKYTNTQKNTTPIKGTKPQWVYILDRKKPELNLQSLKKYVYKPEGEILLQWITADAHLGEFPITIHISKDKGKTWSVLQTNLKDLSPLSLKAPTQDKLEFQYKITVTDLAGNQSSAITETLYVDGALPAAKVTGPKISTQQQFEVIVHLKDTGKAGIEKVGLWFSYDHGKSWNLFSRELNPQNPILFTTEIAKPVSFYATATDSAGNTSADPIPGTAPQHTVLIDTTKPMITIVEPTPFRAIAGGSKIKISWKATDDNLSAFPISLYFSPNNGDSWELITKNEKAVDSFLWTTPTLDAKKCRLKLTARDEVGNISDKQLSFTFEIDSTAPISKTAYLQNQDIPNIVPADKPQKNKDQQFEQIIQDFKEIDSLKENQQFVLALDKLKEMESTYPDIPKIYYEQALLLANYLTERDSSLLSKSIYLLEKAISIDPNYEAAYILKGSLYYKRYSLEKDENQKTHYLLLAEHEYLNAIKILDDNYEEYSSLGVIYFKLNRWEEAKKYFLKATLLQTKPSICYWYLASIEENQGNFGKAEYYWKKAAKAYGVNTAQGEKAVWNAESAKSKQIGKKVFE